MVLHILDAAKYLDRPVRQDVVYKRKLDEVPPYALPVQRRH